jgi:cell division protein FtsA
VINDAKNSVKARAGAVGFEILHCIPQVYDVDDQKEIPNPIGMSGFSLGIHALLLLAETSHLRNVKKAFNMAGLSDINVVVGTVATAEAVINDDERKLGCMILDIGGGTSDMLVYKNNCIHTYICNPQGGRLISNDLEVGLRTPPRSAENLKIEYGNAVPSTVNPDNVVEIEGIGGRQPIKKSQLLISQITQVRLKDILDVCYKQIFGEYTMLEGLTAGVVITGGVALTKNIHNLVEDDHVFNLPCRIAYPDLKRISGAVSYLDNPTFSCAIGLIYYVVKNCELSEGSIISIKDISGGIKESIKKLINKLKEI